METSERQNIVKDLLKIKEYHELLENRLTNLKHQKKGLEATIETQEQNILDFQSQGRTLGEILMPIYMKHNHRDSKTSRRIDDRPNCFIVKSSNGSRYLVTRKEELYFTAGTTETYEPGQPVKEFVNVPETERELNTNRRVALDLTSVIITDSLPREVTPAVFNMLADKNILVKFEEIGGLEKEINQLKEVVEFPLVNPFIFKKVGVTPAKAVLLYGPPGTGKTLIARAIASNVKAKFLKVAAPSILQKYIGESARLIREIFNYAKENAPCIVFVDEVDAIGSKRSNDSSGADREVQRTLIELLNHLDGFDPLGDVKVIMATNRPDTLDPALLRPGRLDIKIEIPLPNLEARKQILEIYLKKMNLMGENHEKNQVSIIETISDSVVSLSEGFNGADLKNITTEAGYLAIREDRDYCVENDFLKAVRKIKANKKMEKQIFYEKV